MTDKAVRSALMVARQTVHRTPSEPQKKAGNYRKGHLSFHGLPVTIENPKGGYRRGVDPNGKPWAVRMPADYGYIKRTEGADGDHVDVYIGPHLSSPAVFIVDQKDAETGRFDEHKVMLGFDTEKDAVETYLKGFSDGKAKDRLGKVTGMSIPSFKAWLKHEDTTRPAARIAKAEGGEVEDDYRGGHTAPDAESGAPLHDVRGVYPDDFYGPNGFRYYADFGNPYDQEAYAKIRDAKARPNMRLEVYRAVPKDQRITDINKGDWVAISRQYAKDHGEHALNGNYKILKKTVAARDLFTAGDSHHEWGYHPSPTMSHSERVALANQARAKFGMPPLEGKAEGGEVGDVPNAMNVFPKPQRMLQGDDYVPGGKYLDAATGEDVTGHKASSASIAIAPGGKPSFTASRDAVDQTGSPGKGAKQIKANLFRRKGRWDWVDAPEGHEDSAMLVSLVQHDKGKKQHYYSLAAHFPKGVDLARYPKEKDEPRLRPTTKGALEFGPQVGSIRTSNGHVHPVYQHIIAKADGGLVTTADDDEEPGITAYQGGPHRVGPEGYDNSKIGTGEGAQVYGHGHYFAEHEPVAIGYRNKLAGAPGLTYDGQKVFGHAPAILKKIHEAGGSVDAAVLASVCMDMADYDPDKALKLIRQRKNVDPDVASEAAHHLLRIKNAPSPGYMHEVRIKGRPEHFLDWDARLSEQPEAYDAIRNHLQRLAEKEPSGPWAQMGSDVENRAGEITGRDMHDMLHNFRGFAFSKKMAARHLSDAGIRGIRYLDAGSRGAGEGTRNYVVFDPKHIEIKRRYAEGGSVDDDPTVNQALALTRPNDMGLYSGAAANILASKQPKGPLDQMLASARGIKPDEIQWSGIHEALGGKKVTREDIARHFAENMPQVQATTLRAGGNEGEPQYGDYTLPGGENYREVLLHLPEREPPNFPDFESYFKRSFTRHSPEAEEYVRQRAMEDWQAAEGKIPDYRSAENYNSSHWDQPNVIAHIRTKDRRGFGGEDVLHLEELQSDWGQAARDYTPANPELRAQSEEAKKQYVDFLNNLVERRRAGLLNNGFTEEQADKALAPLILVMSRNPSHPTFELVKPHLTSGEADTAERLDYMARQGGEKGAPVPPGPYISNTDKWTDLGLKHVLTTAAREGKTHVAWTPGAEQANRFDLSNQVEEIAYNPKEERLYYTPIGADSDIRVPGFVKPEDLPKYLGKEVAERLLAKPKSGSTHYLSGRDLEVGGVGMKKYYDEIVPKALLKLAREHDPEAKLGKVSIGTDGRGVYSLQSLEITPKMRESILQKGFKAFNRGGMAYADGGSVDDDAVNKALALTAPNEMGLYSGAASAALALPQAKGSLSQMLATMKGVKPDEIKGSGVERAFAGRPTVTREDLAQHFSQNMPKLTKTTYSENAGPDDEGPEYNEPEYRLEGSQKARNYREILIHPPGLNDHIKGHIVFPSEDRLDDFLHVMADLDLGDYEYGGIQHKDGNYRVMEYNIPASVYRRIIPQIPDDARNVLHEDDAEVMRKLNAKKDIYRSSHWDVPNVLAHLRMDERKNTNGDNVLHMDELQSDWGQNARVRGIRPPQDEIDRLNQAHDEAERQYHQYVRDLKDRAAQRLISMGYSPEEAELSARNMPLGNLADSMGESRQFQAMIGAASMAQGAITRETNAVPHNPHITSTERWSELGLKQALLEAAKGDHDYLTWTPGEIQAERWKEPGLAEFYDKGVPKSLLKLARQHDPEAAIETVSLPKKPKTRFPAVGPKNNEILQQIGTRFLGRKATMHEADEAARVLRSMDIDPNRWDLQAQPDEVFKEVFSAVPARLKAWREENSKLDVPGIRITPKMRESILKQGFKVFRRGGAV